MSDDLKSGGDAAAEAHWIPLSDLMTGLMVIFMLIAISYMVVAERTTGEMKKMAASYVDLRQQIYLELNKEFRNDLPRWGAEIDEDDLVVRFNNPKVLFAENSAVLQPDFTNILSEFFPRYIGILSRKEFRNSIAEIRIEGHTSSVWDSFTTQEQAYFQNMRLSQDRTRSVLEYVYLLPQVSSERDWLRQHLTANGLSSSHLVFKQDGRTEDEEKSRRVEFRVRTSTEALVEEIQKVAD